MEDHSLDGKIKTFSMLVNDKHEASALVHVHWGILKPLIEERIEILEKRIRVLSS